MDTLYQTGTRVGVVVGTYGSPGYVRLQLENLRRQYPWMPAAVCDDGSPFARQLSDVCDHYDAELFLNTKRLPVGAGDLNCFRTGLFWAKSVGVDLLVKFSRRWLFLDDWRKPLLELARETQAPTFSSSCAGYGFGFRTECIGMHVRSWMKGHFVDDVHDRTQRDDWFLPEAFVHQHATMVLDKIGRPRLKQDVGDGTYAYWKEMGTDRKVKQSHVIWHDCDPPEAYYQLALKYGLDVTPDDFRLRD